jgi:hypothetical protein
MRPSVGCAKIGPLEPARARDGFPQAPDYRNDNPGLWLALEQRLWRPCGVRSDEEGLFGFRASDFGFHPLPAPVSAAPKWLTIPLKTEKLLVVSGLVSRLSGICQGSGPSGKGRLYWFVKDVKDVRLISGCPPRGRPFDVRSPQSTLVRCAKWHKTALKPEMSGVCQRFVRGWALTEGLSLLICEGCERCERF